MPDLLDPTGLLEMMEGHRRLTLRTVEAFPEDALFRFTPCEPLRPFAEMLVEVIELEASYIRGVATGEWLLPASPAFSTKADLLGAAARIRARTRELWPQVTAGRLLSVKPDPFFGGPEQRLLDRLIYALENEVHHRGQGFVYLRLLGIEPPPFYER